MSTSIAAVVELTAKFQDKFSMEASKSAQDGANAIISYAASLEKLGGISMTEAFEVATKALGCSVKEIPAQPSDHPDEPAELPIETRVARLHYNQKIANNALSVARKILG